ncbi:MAG: 30S ribosomal protein S12 methylthiotransferase RimO [Pirellulales bacterium]|nr:30S ribosomal protein S12 methylthiotransferase RimO [Pirellulales bacterium]
MPKTPAKGSYALISLGCPKNLVDTERMAGLLQLDGYRMVSDPAKADFVVVNTCGFIGDARAESHQAIEEMLDLKAKGKLRGVIVTGCLAERDKDRLLQKYPQIDQLVGVFGREDIGEAARRTMAGLAEQRTIFRPAPTRPPEDTHRLRITSKHLAFLKIAEGCNRLCSFCSIPQLRGPYASKPLELIVAEAEELAADGVKELVLVAQDTTFYGIDLYGKPRLAELLQRLDRVEGPAWIRLMYLYPMHIGEGLIDTIAGAKKILPYLDLPLQHINDEVLQRMRRRVNRAETLELLGRLRKGIPRLVLRTTFIAGFPGETEEQFAELLDFVRTEKFERLGAFSYCEEEHTPAVELDGAIPLEIRNLRRDRLLAAQQPIAFAWNKSQVGRRHEVIIDSRIPGQKNAYIGRSYADAPEIDGVVYVTGDNLKPGQIVPCEIVTTNNYDLVAVGC